MSALSASAPWATLLLGAALTLAQVMLTAAMALATLRILRGPRAQDRILGLDTLYVNTMLLFLTLGMREGSQHFFEAALIVALLGFVGTVAFAKFLMRGEVIE
ncbi:K+/H+ antiporter subunit F [Xanthobacter tagetidis]|jgi:multicomponent K+:H+ antiporter subunit F|uniref:K+/H+ antiporter subunit F n=1 Tax=Xanthobacter tagetidis TaxID=60216 RepID=A0A3L7ACA2_9HYPH|nr:K+/H+ antiporter subunit F [Xanthobacter tagetidis]MBB6306065.1 multicomponent K+:H+ antiporter subunit F [Xanthobacter tagetidis]RLP77625.1 K+/H+ antiporter subunit F [Xanthobacter tagetidis]